LTGLKKIDQPGIDFVPAKQMAKAVLAAVRNGKIDYAIITAEKTMKAF
jgi:hypothetical protein